MLLIPSSQGLARMVPHNTPYWAGKEINVSKLNKYLHVHLCQTQNNLHTVFIHIEAQGFISYKPLLTRRLYEPFLHLIYMSIYFRVLNPCVYLGPGVYISPAFIWINMVHMYAIHTDHS